MPAQVARGASARTAVARSRAGRRRRLGARPRAGTCGVGGPQCVCLTSSIVIHRVGWFGIVHGGSFRTCSVQFVPSNHRRVPRRHGSAYQPLPAVRGWTAGMTPGGPRPSSCRSRSIRHSIGGWVEWTDRCFEWRRWTSRAAVPRRTRSVRGRGRGTAAAVGYRPPALPHRACAATGPSRYRHVGHRRRTRTQRRRGVMPAALQP